MLMKFARTYEILFFGGANDFLVDIIIGIGASLRLSPTQYQFAVDIIILPLMGVEAR